MSAPRRATAPELTLRARLVAARARTPECVYFSTGTTPQEGSVFDRRYRLTFKRPCSRSCVRCGRLVGFLEPSRLPGWSGRTGLAIPERDGTTLQRCCHAPRRRQ